MSRTRRSTARLLAVGALSVAAACQDQRHPTAPPPTHANAAAGANGAVKINRMQLSTNKLRINGPGASFTANIANSSGPQTGIIVRAEVAQAAAVQQVVAAAPVHCVNGGQDGSLSTGNCDIALDFSVANVNPLTGLLVQGLAVFRLSVLQTTPAGAVELVSKTTDVNLVATPEITTLTLAATTMGIGGVAGSYTATLSNPANGLQGVQLQAYIVQGLTRRAAGGVLVSCGGPSGLLPTGTCTMTFATNANNAGAGVGTLVPGDAKFELTLAQTSGGTTTTLDTKLVNITLIAGTPKITSITFANPSLPLDGTVVPYSAILQNGGVPVSGVSVQGYIEQTTGGVTASRPAGGASISCGSGTGVVPTTINGPCTVNFTANANNAQSGTGTLVPGLARFVLHLYKTVGSTSTELDVRTVEVSLTSVTLGITALTLSAPYVGLQSAGSTPYTATIQNPGSQLTSVQIQGWISQGTARHAAAGTLVSCGAGSGVLPNGSCDVATVATASNGTSGTGTLVLGPATLEVELMVGSTIVETKTIAITIVPPTPSIVKLALSSTSIPLPGSRDYSVTLFNPTGSTLAFDTFIQGYMEQTGGTSYGGGGTDLQCGGGALPGTLPTGACTVSFVAVASNAAAGTGLLVAGPATFRLQLMQNATLLDEKSVAVTLTPASP
jgi:hypothetical protein